MTEEKLKQGGELLEEINDLKSWRKMLTTDRGLALGGTWADDPLAADEVKSILTSSSPAKIIVGLPVSPKKCIAQAVRRIALNMLDSVIAEKEKQFASL